MSRLRSPVRMLLRPEWFLFGWTVVAGLWWMTALTLVRRDRRVRHKPGSHTETLSIFKPIPCVHDDSLFSAVESFANQLDEHTELLLGIEQQAAARWEPLRRERVKIVSVPRPAKFLSPKVSWLQTLAEHATGDWWMWSDADMTLPVGGLAT